VFRRRPSRRPFLRRLPFRRAPGAPLPSPALSPKVREALIRANRLMANGQFADAALIFEHLAEKAKDHGMVARAADLTLQASRACFAGDDIDAALKHAKESFRLLARGGRAGRVPLLLSKMTAALRSKGYDAQTDELEREAEQIVGGLGLSLEEARQHAPQPPEKRGTLPAKCDGCGAPVVPDEVEWHDAQTAECLYCGTILKAT
jgi:hypothetical protein